MKNYIMYFAFLLYLFATLLFPQTILAQIKNKTTYIEAQVIKVLPPSKTQKEESIQVKVLNGALKGKVFTTKQSPSISSQKQEFETGDKVSISIARDSKGKEVVYILDFIRTDSLILLFILFIAFVLLVGRWKGLFSFFGMVFSFAVITQFIIPQILMGNDPILISILGTMFIIPVTFYATHGISRNTTFAVIGTISSLILTGLLAYIFVEMTQLTGFAAEEASYIEFLKGGSINIKSLLLAGIIIGALGVLDDITISQAGIVDKLAQANSKYNFRQLYKHSISLGRDHIASLVNTLVLVYAGAALPLFILFYDSKVAFSMTLNQEIVATEIVRTLVSSIGIISAVPITTFIACWDKRRR